MFLLGLDRHATVRLFPILQRRAVDRSQRPADAVDRQTTHEGTDRQHYPRHAKLATFALHGLVFTDDRFQDFAAARKS